jgi:membrane fusion protein, heavy metal efflux system
VAETPLTPLTHLTRILSRSTQLVLVIGLAVIIGGAFGVRAVVDRFFTRQPSAAVTAPAAPGTFRPTPAQLVGLKIEPVRTEIFRTEETTDGNIAIDDDHTTPVFSPYSGRVTRLIAKLGDHVEKGAPLMAIEASEFVQGQNDLIAALATLKTSHAQLNLAQTSEKRQHDLYLAKGGALKDWQQSQVDLATAEGNLRTAEIALASVRNRLRILGKSDAEIDAIEAAPSAQQLNPDAVIYAPIAGTVIQRQVGLGQYIQSGASNPVYSIGDLSTVWLIANVRESDAAAVHVGDPVEVNVLAYPGRVFRARIVFVASSVDAATHRLPVRAEVENPDGALKPEMFASFRIITGNDVTAPAVPQSAIVYEGDTARLWVVGQDSSIAAREIEVGHTQNGLVEVVHGLQPGEKVVVSGTLFIDRAARGD